MSRPLSLPLSLSLRPSINQDSRWHIDGIRRSVSMITFDTSGFWLVYIEMSKMMGYINFYCVQFCIMICTVSTLNYFGDG